MPEAVVQLVPVKHCNPVAHGDICILCINERLNR